ncbi:hypothetical protein [Mycolicibacterium lutetiense]|uniref:Secreted protein n=1 Tax=Mycolicibacterium lutetiense TaxID=1641992 RepID=A0ABS4ZRR3_9MYCO|nr:hypothetical protein [Mycolicibacterium lutetiense]MBP2452188.1 hypothetical protein [Mycolicibacterium lutetiense]
MKLTKFVATALTVGAFGMGVTGLGAPVASASPVAPVPLKPGHGNDDCFPFCDGGGPPGHDRDFDRGRDFDNRRPDFDNRGHDFDNRRHRDDKGPWWSNNRHDWWDDRQGPPPWGWGPPPPFQWRGGHLPPTINYWGYNLNPVWDHGFRQWGVWLFGVWIPILGVG